MTDPDRTELIEALVRLATGYEQALVLVDKALGVSGPQKRLTAGDLAGARGEAAACRAQLIAVRLRGASCLMVPLPEPAYAVPAARKPCGGRAPNRKAAKSTHATADPAMAGGA